MKCLYKVPFSGFFMAYAESAEDAKKMSPPPMMLRLFIPSNPREMSRLAPMARPSRLMSVTACSLNRQMKILMRASLRIGRMSCEH